MSSFVFYNPKTNTIERRQPTQPNTFQMPYLLNIQPQDINYAMKNTQDLRSYPSSIPYPDRYEKENLSSNIETRKPMTLTENYGKPSKEFLMMEDLREEDIGGPQQHYKPNKEQSNKYSQNPRAFDQRETIPKKNNTGILKASQYPEEEAREKFNIINHEDMVLKYRPEDYSINERILNARFVQEEQEKTRKFVLNRIGTDIQAMEAKASGLEKEIQIAEKETQALDKKTQQIWDEIERKKFELKANDILKRIDQAVNIENDFEEQEQRYDNFYRENEALYDEINRVLEEGGEEEEEEILYTEETDRFRLPVKQKSSGYGRSTSSGVRNTRKTGFSGNRSSQYTHSQPKKGLGQKSVVKAYNQNKPSNNMQTTKVQKRPLTSNSQQVAFKNPKKVEEALQKAKAIVDLY